MSLDLSPRSSDGERVVYGACPHDCPDCCALETRVNNAGRAISVKGRADHPVTRGWLCAKVNRYLERVYHPDRLLYPQRRSGPRGSGAFERISWEEALDEIGKRWREIIDQAGAQSILPYSYSGTLGLVNGAVTDKRFWRRLGASQLERAICGAAAEEAALAAAGTVSDDLNEANEDEIDAGHPGIFDVKDLFTNVMPNLMRQTGV